MAEMTAEMDQIQVPDGGVASFMMSDEDIDNLEREEDQQLAEEVYGGEGISQFTDMAAQMASLGRFGDDVIVHAQTGELVIPKKILDDNPEIKQMVLITFLSLWSLPPHLQQKLHLQLVIHAFFSIRR